MNWRWAHVTNPVGAELGAAGLRTPRAAAVLARNPGGQNIVRIKHLLFSWRVLVPTISLLAGALYLDLRHRSLLNRLLGEDGPVEWFTVLALLAALGYAVAVTARAWRASQWRAVLVWTAIAAAALFGAGEEVSWGQRLFDLTTPDWLRSVNRQRELNVHNLVLAGVSINKVVFSYGLGVLAGAYFAVVPALWSWSARARTWLEPWRFPIARGYQTAALLLVVLTVSSMGASRRWELTEALSSFCFLLTVVDPRWGSPFASFSPRVWAWPRFTSRSRSTPPAANRSWSSTSDRR